MISVIIPTYNRKHTIMRAIESVLEQTFQDLELLIVDDGSTDGTKELVEQIKDDRLRYILLEKNKGVANARNVGVEHAKGEWIAFQDSDDCWHRDKLEKQMKYADEQPEFDMIYCSSFVHFDGKDHPIKCPVEPLPPLMEGNIFRTLVCRNVIDAPTIFVRKSSFFETGGFNVGYNSLEDWEFVLRFSKKFLIGYLPEALMDSYILEGGVSSRIAEHYESRCRMLAENRDDFIREGLFDKVALDILEKAKASGILEPVKQMMMLYLQDT